jgi:hypothetical protein
MVHLQHLRLSVTTYVSIGLLNNSPVAVNIDDPGIDQTSLVGHKTHHNRRASRQLRLTSHGHWHPLDMCNRCSDQWSRAGHMNHVRKICMVSRC